MSNSNECSIESIYALGTGFKKADPVFKSEEELSDHDSDSAYAEIASLESVIDFADAYQKLETKKASDKMKMLKRIGVTYRGKSASLESFLYDKSLEAGSAAAAVGGTETPKDAGVDSDKVDEKKHNFVAKIFIEIGKFFVKIWNWITDHIKMLVAKIKSFFTSKETVELEEQVEAVIEESGTDEREVERQFHETPLKLSKIADDKLSKSASSEYLVKMDGRVCETLTKQADEFAILGANLVGAFNVANKNSVNDNNVAQNEYNKIIETSKKILRRYGAETPNFKEFRNEPDSLKNGIKAANSCAGNISYDKHAKEYLTAAFNNVIEDNGKLKVKDIFGNVSRHEVRKICKQTLIDLDKISSKLKPVIAKINNAANTFSKTLTSRETAVVVKGDKKDSINSLLMLQSLFKIASKVSSECFMKPIKAVTSVVTMYPPLYKTFLKNIISLKGKAKDKAGDLMNKAAVKHEENKYQSNLKKGSRRQQKETKAEHKKILDRDKFNQKQ